MRVLSYRAYNRGGRSKKELSWNISIWTAKWNFWLFFLRVHELSYFWAIEFLRSSHWRKLPLPLSFRLHCVRYCIRESGCTTLASSGSSTLHLWIRPQVYPCVLSGYRNTFWDVHCFGMKYTAKLGTLMPVTFICTPSCIGLISSTPTKKWSLNHKRSSA